MKTGYRSQVSARRPLALLLTLALLLSFVIPAASAADGAENGGKTVIRVFETSDIHGYLMETAAGDEAEFQYRLAYISQVVKDARASGAYDDVLLLDGGDIYQGAPASNLLYGAAVRAAMDQMDYDAVSLGNHEFDWGVEETCADPDGTIPAYSVGEFSGDPDTPILASNLYDAETGERVGFTKDYIITEKAGLRIAIVGYIPDYRNSIMSARIAPYTIDPSLEKLSARIREINEQEQPDLTVVLAHEEPTRVAEAMDPEQVALVAGGHDHAGRFGCAESGVAYIQADKYAVGYASANIVIDRTTGEVTVEEPAYTEIVGTELEERLLDTPDNAKYLDPAVMAVSHAAWKLVGEGMGEVLGYVDQSVEKYGFTDDTRQATSGGDFITGLMLEATRDLDTVAAFYNRGGVRADWVPEEGSTRNVTVGDVYAINPFCNTWLVFDLTGAELAQQLINGLYSSNYGNQMSGLTFTFYQLGQGEHARYYIDSITLSDGTQVDIHDTETTYRVCTSNYSSTLAGGVFEGKTPIVPEVDAPVDNITIIELLRKHRDAGEDYIAVDVSPRAARLPVCDLHTDVSTDAWCHEAVDYVMENGLMFGISMELFAPADTLTRAMAVSTLYRFAQWPEIGEGEAFSDVPAGAWYSDPVAWASESGVAAGYGGGIFGLNDALTREQLVTMLWRWYGAQEADEAALESFRDAGSVSDWARQAFAWAIGEDVIHGIDGALAPQAAATRAELAQILWQLGTAAETEDAAA